MERDLLKIPVNHSLEIISIERDGYLIPVSNFEKFITKDNCYTFSANDNPGNYVITLRPIITQGYAESETYTVRFNVNYEQNDASSNFVLSCTNNATVKGPVSLSYTPYWLTLTQGKTKIILYKDSQEKQTFSVNIDPSNDANYLLQELFTVSEAGLYSVRVYNADNKFIYGASWTIEAEQSSFGYIILAVVGGAVGVGILVFVRMRRKMTTK